MHVDHVVLWVADQRRSLAFYVEVLGLSPVRADEFERGDAGFPSVRVNETTIFDLMDSRSVSSVRKFTGGATDAGGARSNHVCLSMTASEHAALLDRLRAHGVDIRPGGEHAFGARGNAVRSVYLDDPDGNVLEVRYYERA